MSGLDDFFKKRDKKKKTTTKNKFSTIDTEELAKNLETATIKVEETDPDFQDDNERVGNPSENLDEEWKPFDSEENKDYTGLRINTQTWKAEDEENEIINSVDTTGNTPACPWGAGGKSKKNESDGENDNEDEEKEETSESNELSEPKTIAAVLAENTSVSNALPTETKVESTGAPVASKTTSTTGAYIPPSMRARMQAEQAPKPVEAPKPASSGGAYVPPSMRNRMGGGETSSSSGYDIPTSSVNYRRPGKAQPNFNDCLEFPSLDATGTENKASNGTDERFEYAKKSGRVEPKNEKDSQINLQNKFTMLNQQNQ